MLKSKILTFSIFISILLSAQDKTSNLQAFTPSTLFSPGEYEASLYNSLYTQNQSRGLKGNLINNGVSQAFYNSQFQVTTGIKKFPKINFGVEVNFTSARYGSEKDNAPTDFFKGDKSFSRSLISSVGPRIKFNVTKKIPRLSVQSTFLIPLSDKLEKGGFVAHRRYTWFTQFFFDKNITKKVQLFLEADLLYRIKIDQKRNFIRTPLSAFLSYFPTSKSTIFIFGQYSPRFQNLEISAEKEFGLVQWFTQVGMGAKYQLTTKLAAELSYSKFVAGRLEGAGYSVNIGLRYINR